MTKELILHVGTTKTGSTSIQHVLDARASELPAQGAYWPATHGAKRHLLMALSHSSIERFHDMLGNPLWQGMEPARRIEAYGREFSDEMNELPATVKRVILSAEQFSEMLRTRNDIAKLHATLQPFFATMTVVIYLRRQDSHYSSMYAQMLRMGNLCKPDLSGVKVGFNHDYDYADLIGRWASVFGKANIKPRIFEQSGPKKFDVVDDFLSISGLKLTKSNDDQQRSRNPSMNLVGQRVLLQVGDLHEQKSGSRVTGSPLWAKIADAVTQVAPGNGWLPTKGDARTFLQRFAAGNEVVRAEYFPERETLFCEDFGKLPELEPEDDPGAGFRTACAALLEAASASLRREQVMLMQVAKAAQSGGDSARMRQALVQLIAIDANNIAARLLLIRHHIAKNELKKARGILEAAARIAPQEPGVRRLQRELRLLEGDAPKQKMRAEA